MSDIGQTEQQVDTTVKNLRNYIYLLETGNLHKQKPHQRRCLHPS